MDKNKARRKRGGGQPAEAASEALTPPEREEHKPVSLPAEVIEALDSPTASVDVNVLLVQLFQKEPDPAQFLEQSERLLDMAQEIERSRLENFKARADAVIDAKNRDPDEVDKRANNATRRFLKRVIGCLAPVALVAAVLGLWFEAPAMVMVMLLTVVALSVTFAGVLATGESVTTSDVVQILRELTRRPFGGQSGERTDEQKPARTRRSK